MTRPYPWRAASTVPSACPPRRPCWPWRGIAAYVSYWHAYAVVRAHGETGITARLEPATIDGLVYASSMVVLYAARHRVPVPCLARWLLGLGIAATLTANMAQGWSHGLVGGGGRGLAGGQSRGLV